MPRNADGREGAFRERNRWVHLAPGVLVGACVGAFVASNVASLPRAVANVPATPTPVARSSAPQPMTSATVMRRPSAISPAGAAIAQSPAAPTRVVVPSLTSPGDARRRAVPHRISDGLLARLIGSCAAEVDPRTEAAVVAVESGGDAWALHDDNDDSHYAPDSYGDAVALANELMNRDRRTHPSADRGLDVGVAQINSANFASLGVDAARMFDPCDNLRASAKIIVAAYVGRRSALREMSGRDGDQLALQQALEIYNSGKGSGDDAYVQRILASLDTPFVRTIAASASRETGAEQSIAQWAPFDASTVSSNDDRLQDAAESRSLLQASVVPARPSRRSAPKRNVGAEPTLRSAVFVHVDTAAQSEAGGDAAPATTRNGSSFVHEAQRDVTSGAAVEKDAPRS